MNDQEIAVGEAIAPQARTRVQSAMDRLNALGEYTLEEQIKAQLQIIIENIRKTHGRAYQLASDERIKMGCCRLLMNIEQSAPLDSELAHPSRPLNPETILALQAILGTDDVK